MADIYCYACNTHDTQRGLPTCLGPFASPPSLLLYSVLRIWRGAVTAPGQFDLGCAHPSACTGCLVPGSAARKLVLRRCHLIRKINSTNPFSGRWWRPNCPPELAPATGSTLMPAARHWCDVTFGRGLRRLGQASRNILGKEMSVAASGLTCVLRTCSVPLPHPACSSPTCDPAAATIPSLRRRPASLIAPNDYSGS